MARSADRAHLQPRQVVNRNGDLTTVYVAPEQADRLDVGPLSATTAPPPAAVIAGPLTEAEERQDRVFEALDRPLDDGGTAPGVRSAAAIEAAIAGRRVVGISERSHTGVSTDAYLEPRAVAVEEGPGGITVRLAEDGSGYAAPRLREAMLVRTPQPSDTFPTVALHGFAGDDGDAYSTIHLLLAD